jgi:hypothetical protein
MECVVASFGFQSHTQHTIWIYRHDHDATSWIFAIVTETMAMKALFYSSMDRKEEAHELIKKSLKNNITNGTCE